MKNIFLIVKRILAALIVTAQELALLVQQNQLGRALTDQEAQAVKAGVLGKIDGALQNVEQKK